MFVFSGEFEREENSTPVIIRLCEDTSDKYPAVFKHFT